MEGALRAYRNGLLSEEKLGNFRSVIQSSLDRIAETSRSSSSSLSAIKIAGFTNSQALSDVVDNIRSMCSDTDLFHDKSMEKQFSTLVSGAHNITLINNPQIDGDLISDGGKKMRDSFSNNEGGIIGSGNTVSNSEIKVSWNDMDPNSEIDVKELEKELVKLHAALAEKASEDSEFEETSSVSTALLAAQKDKKSAIMKALGKTGSWVLETAKDIGVPIAVGILTTLAGA